MLMDGVASEDDRTAAQGVNVFGSTSIQPRTRADAMGRDGTTSTHELDVRDLDEPPFEPITNALSALDAGEELVIVNEFEPEPLYDVLEQRGFSHHTERVGADEWRVFVTRESRETRSG